MSLEILSRLQFAFTIGFHIIWPTITIGLGLYLLVIEILFLYTNREIYLSIFKFWAKIYALAFGIGVVTGVPLSYEMGTNFSHFSYVGGAIMGPLLGVEVMTAFFLEAAFIGVMLFGWGRIPNWLHFVATCCVVLGTHNSAFWAIAANSFMHTPQGVSFEDGRMVVDSWLQVIFTPTLPYKMAHMILASYLTAGLLTAGVSSWFLLKHPESNIIKMGLKVAVTIIAIIAPLQILVGDLAGLKAREYQPAKVAAIEALWHTQKSAPLVLFAWPDIQTRTNKYSLAVPSLGSLILTHSWDGQVTGLNEFQQIGHPNVPIVFFAFRIMVGCGLIILLLGFIGLYQVYIKKLQNISRWFLWSNILCSPLGIVAVISGWVVTEVGRQPWILYGHLKTNQGLSKVIPETVLVSLIGYVVIYSLLLFAFLYYLRKLILQGPEAIGKEHWLKVVSYMEPTKK